MSGHAHIIMLLALAMKRLGRPVHWLLNAERRALICRREKDGEGRAAALRALLTLLAGVPAFECAAAIRPSQSSISAWPWLAAWCLGRPCSDERR